MTPAVGIGSHLEAQARETHGFEVTSGQSEVVTVATREAENLPVMGTATGEMARRTQSDAVLLQTTLTERWPIVEPFARCYAG
jgi:hypothetical protein